MKQELDEKLVKTFPKIFRDRYASVNDTCMAWGFTCDDGWYWLIYNLCDALQWDIDHNRRPQVVASQVKEKFGTLRFYVGSATEEQFATIHFAEFLSGSLCELCGSTRQVKQTKGGWIKTLCDKCMKAEQEKWESTESKS